MEYRVVEHSWEKSSIYKGDNPICLVQIDGNVTEETQNEFEEEMDERAQMICDALNKADLAQSLADALEGIIENAAFDCGDDGTHGYTAITEQVINEARAALANYRKGGE